MCNFMILMVPFFKTVQRYYSPFKYTKLIWNLILFLQYINTGKKI